MWQLQTWLAVLKDLWQFLWGESMTLPERLPAPIKGAPVSAATNQLIAETTKTQFEPATYAVVDERYVMVDRAPVSVTPFQAFDSVLTQISFGEAVTVRAYQGAYAHIMTAAGPGWIAKDSLESDRTKIWPNLTTDTVYLADSTVTEIIRRHLGDRFNASALQLPLQSVEYVSYRLRQVKRAINWGTSRPRVPGTWQQHLKGRPGIHIGIQPLADSIMEYQTDTGTGVVYYVEAVTPDNTLICSTVGLEVAGQYTAHSFPAALWREWRPVFIDVTF